MNTSKQMLSRIKLLNPGTKYLINRAFNRDKYSFIVNAVSALEKINSMEDEIKKISPAHMIEKTSVFRKRVQDGESLDNILPEAFAVAREAGKRMVDRPFDVQIIGGIVLHNGKVAEMVTGEGKTLVATLSLYLNSLAGKGCHLVTVNDYLAKWGVQWMGPIYNALGLSTGCIVSFKETKGAHASTAYMFDPESLSADARYLYLRPCSRKEAYLCDITYGVGSEFGFDYLRDNMSIHKENQVQRALPYAIIDEVDSVLIDEARTPLIISGPAEESTGLYYDIDKLGKKLNKDTDFITDEEGQTVSLTEEGVRKCERLLNIQNLYDGAHTGIVHHINQTLRAHNFFSRDKDYVVKDGQVIIVDSFTGRLMPGRRWSDGLHQAIEAKEGVRIERENQTLATVSYQNYFKLYDKLSGMTGTALTEAVEFKEIYNLDVIAIPTNKNLQRAEHDDEIYKTEKEKFNAVVGEIKQVNDNLRPVLVGTASIEKAEKISRLLRHENITHHVLHGKNHEAEAAIIAQAGRPGAVTIATQMAGRGVDIILGGNPDVLAREETIKVIWSKRAHTQQKKKTKTEFHEEVNQVDETYKQEVQKTEEKFGSLLNKLKNDLNEKEIIFDIADKDARYTIEKKLFENKAGAEYKKLQPRLQKLKERYESASEQYNQLQKQFSNKPEKTKDAKELSNRSFREYDSLRASMKRKCGIYEKEDVANERSLLLDKFEKINFNPESFRKIMADVCIGYIEVVETYERDMVGILEENSCKEFTAKSKNYKNFLQASVKQLEKIQSNEQASAYRDHFLSKEGAGYEQYQKAMEEFEKTLIAGVGGNNYPEASSAYANALTAYEQTQTDYKKDIVRIRIEYEKNRGQFEEEWRDARDELEKSPENFKMIYEESLAQYKQPWAQQHAKVIETGGLHVIGTERHEARRIDNQLKGRAGRQGDPGASRFYLSLDDELLRVFGSDRLMSVMSRLPEGDKINHPLITRLINNAQRKVEGRNFEIRKQLVEFDNVLNDQRKIIYSLRQDILEGKNIEQYIQDFWEESLSRTFDECCNDRIQPDKWNLNGLTNYFRGVFALNADIQPPETLATALKWKEQTAQKLAAVVEDYYNNKKERIGPAFEEVQKMILLQVIDNRWKSHLRALDALREGINLRAYAQKDPLVAYKQEGYRMFQEMLLYMHDEVLSYLFKVEISEEHVRMHSEESKSGMSFIHDEFEQFGLPENDESEAERVPAANVLQPNQTPVQEGSEGNPQNARVKTKIGRNDPCPCGSDKKYKKCCGKNV